MTFDIEGRRLLICNCERTMEIDGRKLARCLGGEGEIQVHSHLCRTQIESFERALADDRPLLVACTQEAPLFREVAEEKGGGDVAFVNIRERAGWSRAKGDALPKMAALLAEGAYAAKPTGTIPIVSEGVCLVYGAGQQVLEVAERLAGRLNVSAMLTDVADAMPPSVAEVPIHKGRIVRATGSLGRFEIVVDGYAPMVPSSRQALAFVMERDGASSKCDIVIDLSGGAPLFPAASRRDGYFHVDPRHPAAVAKAMFEATDLVGEFEKPIYVHYEADICAHGRSGKTGCTNCLDNCPVSAIVADGDKVRVDPRVCGGCGNCSASCPTGAVSYAYPGREDVIGRAQALLGAYAAAGGRDPVLLLHDERHGAALIAAMARHGRGLPANVLPMSLHAVTQLGHETLLAALAAGAGQVLLLAPPDRRDELAAMEAQAELANVFMSGLGLAGDLGRAGELGRARVLVEGDPDALEAALHELPRTNGLAARSFAAVGGKRDIARTVIGALRDAAKAPPEVLALAPGSPYGRIHIDTQGCTLCLACVGACPVDALSDSPERPRVRFTEAACVQCGLCKATCPERVISLEPRYNFAPAAMTPIVLNEAEPFACVRCGKPFGTKASVERVAAKLRGKHWMFQSEEQLRIVQMCDDCRIVTLSESGNDPFAKGERPRVRTTDDYLEAEEMARKTGKSPEDFLT